MYSTTAYLYQQKTRVLSMDTGGGSTFIYRYDPVYAKKLTINKGINNVLLFEFVNQEEKPVNITGSTLNFRVVSQDGTELLLQAPMTILNAATGRAKVEISNADLTNIRAQTAGYSIQRIQAGGGYNEAVFTDAQAGARAPIDIVDSVYPEYVPSTQLTIPTVQITAQAGIGAATSSSNYPDWAGTQGVNNWSPYQSTEFYSSYIEPTASVTTIQIDLVGYTGTIKVQGAENYQSLWYNVTESIQYLNKTGTIHINVLGWHPLLRIAFNNSIYTTGANGPGFGNPAQATAVVNGAGVITGVTINQAGIGYLAPPLVEFVGDGAGAIAVASVSEGSVYNIDVIDGGAGYRPSPPTNNQALVIISTGRAENIFYR